MSDADKETGGGRGIDRQPGAKTGLLESTGVRLAECGRDCRTLADRRLGSDRAENGSSGKVSGRCVPPNSRGAYFHVDRKGPAKALIRSRGYFNQWSERQSNAPLRARVDEHEFSVGGHGSHAVRAQPVLGPKVINRKAAAHL